MILYPAEENEWRRISAKKYIFYIKLPVNNIEIWGWYWELTVYIGIGADWLVDIEASGYLNKQSYYIQSIFDLTCPENWIYKVIFDIECLSLSW